MGAPFIQFDKVIIGATAAAATLIMGSCGPAFWASPPRADAPRPGLSDRDERRSPVFAGERFGRSGGAGPLPRAVAPTAD